MTDQEVRSWFADKLKAIVKDWLNDNTSKDGWSRINKDEVDYLRDGQTVAGAYKAYDSLKGREDKTGKQIKIKTKKRATYLSIGDLVGVRKVVNVIKPLTRRDTIVTIVYDNEEVQRISADDELEVTEIKTVE